MVRLLLALPQYSVTFDDCMYIPKMFFDLKYNQSYLLENGTVVLFNTYWFWN